MLLLLHQRSFLMLHLLHQRSFLKLHLLHQRNFILSECYLCTVLFTSQSELQFVVLYEIGFFLRQAV